MLENSELATETIGIEEDGVLTVTDFLYRCQIHEVSVDNKFLGETYGTGPLDASHCGSEEECMNSGGAHGFFFVPKGRHTIGARWVKVTEACSFFTLARSLYKIRAMC